MSFRDPNLRKDCCSGDRDKLKDVKAKIPFQNIVVPGVLPKDPRVYKKSKSSGKLLSSIPSGIYYPTRNKESSKAFISQSLEKRSPLRSSRGSRMSRKIN